MTSIYNTIRSAKVTTGNAAQFAGMRTFDESAQVCPVRANVSDSGVIGVAKDTTYSQAAGCNSALNRIVIEGALRPDYSTYLNADAINMPGVGDESRQAQAQYQSKPFYDTQLGGMAVRPVLSSNNLNPRYNASSLVPNQPVSKQMEESNYVSGIMNQTYENRRINQYL